MCLLYCQTILPLVNLKRAHLHKTSCLGCSCSRDRSQMVDQKAVSFLQQFRSLSPHFITETLSRPKRNHCHLKYCALTLWYCQLPCRAYGYNTAINNTIVIQGISMNLSSLKRDPTAILS